MTWVRFDDQYPTHPKVENLSDPAFRLGTSAIFWCARNLMDGYVSAGNLGSAAPRKMKRPDRFAAELVDAGSWHVSGEGCASAKCPASVSPGTSGWVIHDYWDYQPSKEKVLEDREAKAKRQARWLAGKQKGRSKDASTDASTQQRDASRDVSTDASRDANPAPPRPEGSGGGSPRQRQGAAGAPRNGARDDHRAELRQLAIANCTLCDNNGYAGTRLCDHDPEAPARAARGRALVQAALEAKR